MTTSRHRGGWTAAIGRAAEANSLTDQQERFAREYVANGGNASRAARSAGYSRRSAHMQGSRLLRNDKVAARIRTLEAESAARLELQADDVLRELARLAFGRLDRVAMWGPRGVELRPMEELTDDDRAAVAELTQTVTRAGGTIRIKMHDKIGALDKLARKLGLYEKHDAATSPLGENQGMTDAELAERAEQLRARRLAHEAEKRTSG